MNLGDGLKLETQILDGKPKLILAPCAKGSRIGKQTGFKKGSQEQAAVIKPTGQLLKATLNRQIIKATQNDNVLKATQNTFVTTEKPISKKRTGSGLSETKSEKNYATLVSKKPYNEPFKQVKEKDRDVILHQDNHLGKQNAQKGPASVKKDSQSTVLSKQRTHKKHNLSADDLRESLVCLTQEQFQQILKTINQATRSTDHANDCAEKTPEDNDSSKEESINGLVRKASDASSVQEGKNSSCEQHEAGTLMAQKDHIKNTQQDGDLFSTLGERERDKTFLEEKKSQWRKELDAQVALKKKEKESSSDHTQYGVWANSSPGNIRSVKINTTVQPKVTFSPFHNAETENLLKASLGMKGSDAVSTVSNGPSLKPSSFSSPDLPAAIRTAFVMGEAAPLDHAFSAVKREQRKKWVEELNKQREEDSIRKMKEKMIHSAVEDHDRWAMHFDSLKKANSPALPLNPPQMEQLEVPLLIPEQEEPIDLPFSDREKGFENSSDMQKSSFLRSMTALLDPAQIEERDRKRQKQLEHQKAIAAQVEEKRKRKQIEEELRQREEQDEEQRLSLERQLIQRQFDEDLLKQKQKEEILTLKTKELYQSMQRAQEEAQKLKQEQRIRSLAQRGHNISNLQMNLGASSLHLDSARVESSLSCVNRSIESCAKMSHEPEMVISPRIDTAVQTDDYTFGTNNHSKAYIGEDVHRENSPDIAIEFKEQTNSKKQKTDTKHPAKKNISSKENNFSSETKDQFARRESEVKLGPKHIKKPVWNANKGAKIYVPASERYPKGHQKQREENKTRRQMELLHLVERNMSQNMHHKNVSPAVSPSPQDSKKENYQVIKDAPNSKREHIVKRSESPPVPAVKNKLNQLQQRHLHGSNPPVQSENRCKDRPIRAELKQNEPSPGKSESEFERPPSSHHFIPFVRTKEVYYLDPEAPMSRPSTHDPQYKRINGGDHQPRQIFSSDHMRDPLLNPNVVKNKDRQQAILKGLSELRQGLLQKQKELETGLIPDVN
ncbi:coiled-coil domain-containing protein 66 [Ambystoma mexicanum]|uniref:coiled-coil domain-containing protein 66 n=1 Tax=Ambystoma mexicanum TaxID=8296 RepID=UPI0037E7BC38